MMEAFIKHYSVLAKYPAVILFGTSWSWFTIKYFPSAMIFFWLVVTVFVDLVTGLLKAWSKGESTTSSGLRKTVIKILSYSGAVVVVVVLVNMVGMTQLTNADLDVLIDSLLGFIVFIELFSICENISEAYPKSALVIYLIGPITRILKFRIKNNPLSSIEDPLSNESKKSERDRD